MLRDSGLEATTQTQTEFYALKTTVALDPQLGTEIIHPTLGGSWDSASKAICTINGAISNCKYLFKVFSKIVTKSPGPLSTLAGFS